MVFRSPVEVIADGVIRNIEANTLMVWQPGSYQYYGIRLRLSQAAYQLRNRRIRVGEAARLVGIDDVYYFSKLMKKHFGKSPRELRQQ